MSSSNSINIPKWAKKFITAEECVQIGRAIDEAEKKTKGEIVPMIVRSSAAAHLVPWVASLILLLILFVIDDLCPMISGSCYEWVLVPVFIAGLFFFRTSWARERLHRTFIHPVDRHSQVLARAELEFHRSRFDKTAEHSSILIMASLLERDVVVFADSGVVAHVKQETWHEVVDELIAGIKNGRVAEGWIGAIGKAGEILTKNFPAENHDLNQIANEIIIRE